MVQQLMPAEEAAMILGTTLVNVLMHLKRGLLEGEQSEGRWLVSTKSLEALLADENRGAEPLCKSHCGKAAAGCSCG